MENKTGNQVENSPKDNNLEPIYSNELNYLNHNWDSIVKLRTDVNSIESKFNIKGIILKKIRNFLHNLLLDEPLREISEFNKNLVMFLNNSTKFNNEKHSKSFWQIIEKIDSDIDGAVKKGESINLLTINELENLKLKINSLIDKEKA